MESWQKPMLARSISPGQTFDNRIWAVEGKYDGIRVVVHRDAGTVRLYCGRNASNYTGHLPYLDPRLLASLPADTCIDGELMSPLGRGAVQSALFTNEPHIPRSGAPELYIVMFDVLRVAGQDVRSRPWHERRRLIEAIPLTTGLKLSPLLPLDGALEVALRAGLEGVVYKQRAAGYVNKRSGVWVKDKPQAEAVPAVIIGFKPGKPGGRWDGKVGAFEVELLDENLERTGLCTTVKCGTDGRHIEATYHPERWANVVIDLNHHGIQPSGIPLHPQYGCRRDDLTSPSLAA